MRRTTHVHKKAPRVMGAAHRRIWREADKKAKERKRRKTKLQGREGDTLAKVTEGGEGRDNTKRKKKSSAPKSKRA